MGYVDCLPLQNAFGPDARFFILDPPKDANGNSTRYLVLQRALASVGVCFQYHLRAVSCEAFAMTMMNAEPDWRSLQLQVLNNTMVTSVKMTKEKRQADAAMYQEFYKSIVARWRMLDQPVILTLKYLVNTYTMRKVFPLEQGKSHQQLNREKKPWFRAMIADYQKFFNHVSNGQINMAEAGLIRGLDVNSGLDFFQNGGKVTPLQMLNLSGKHGNKMYKYLVQREAIEHA